MPAGVRYFLWGVFIFFVVVELILLGTVPSEKTGAAQKLNCVCDCNQGDKK